VDYARALRLMMVMEEAEKKWIRILVIGNALNLAMFLMNLPYLNPRKFCPKLLSLFA
jgi:hypothetical protein